MPVRSRRQKRLIWIVVLLGLLLRLGWGLPRSTTESSLTALPDQLEYLHLGRNLLHHDTLFFDDPRFQQAVFAYRMPGYPVFVAICGGNVRAIRVVQAVLGAANVLAIFWLVESFLPFDLALLAGLFVAADPYLIYFSGLVLSETLCTSLLLWGVIFCMGVRIQLKWLGAPIFVWRGLTLRGSFQPAPASTDADRRKIVSRILGPILLALAVMVRPSALLLPVLLPIGVWLLRRSAERIESSDHSTIEPTIQCSDDSMIQSHRRTPGFVWLIAGPIIGAAALAILLSAWAWRNHVVLGDWIWGTTNSGITMYDGFNPHATGASDQSFVQRMPYLAQLNEVNRSAYLAELASKYMQSHRSRVYSLALAKFERTYSPIPLSAQFGRPLYQAIGAVYSIPIFLLALCGLLLRTIDWRAKTLLLIVPVYFAIVHALTIGSLRYRMPAEPFIAALAAAGLWSLWIMFGRKKPHGAATPCSGVVA